MDKNTFLTFCKQLTTKSSDTEINDLFRHLCEKNKENSPPLQTIVPQKLRKQKSVFDDGKTFEFEEFEILFEKFYNSESSVSQFINAKFQKQKLIDFQKKLDVWQERLKVR